MHQATVLAEAPSIVAEEPAIPAGRRSYRVARINTEEELCALREAWDALTAACANVPVFETWEWISTWWRHRDVGDRLWVLAAWDEAGALAGLMPWMLISQGRWPIRFRRLTFIGRGVVYPVHLDVLARAGEEQPVCSAFVAYLNAHTNEWDVLDLGDLRQESPLKACLAGVHGYVRELTGAVALVTALPATWQAYEKEKLSSTRRKHLGQYRRKLEREYPDLVRFYEISDPAEVRRALDTFADLNRTRWHEKRVVSSFDNEAFVAFHHEMAVIALEKHWLRFYVLRVGDDMAAGIYGFLYRKVFYVYQAAFNATWGKYGPGQLMFGYGIGRAIEDGACEWNMMRGDQDYKASWTDCMRLDGHIVVSASLAGHAWLLAASLVDAAKAIGRERLPQVLQTRLGKLISAKGTHKHEAARADDISH